MTCVLKRYTWLVFAALAIAGCTEEVKQLETNLQIITPDRQDIISLDGIGHQLVLKLERSGSFEWDIDVSSVSGGNAEDWCHCYKLSDSEIAVEVKPHLKKLDPLVFESRQCTIEAFVLSKPELRSSCTLIQKYAASPYLSVRDLSVGEEAPTDFNVPFTGDTFTFDVISRFPLEMTVSDSDIHPELIISESETTDECSGTLSVTIPENLAEVTKVIEVKIGNTIIVDGIEKEYYKVLKFTQASQQFSFEKVTPSANNLFYGGESFDVVVTSEMPWNLVADCPDVEFSTSSGTPGSKTVSVQFPANMTDSERTVILTLTQKGTGQNRTIQVVQDKFGGISYTTTDNQKIMIAEAPMKVSSHIYENGTGRIATKEPLLEIPVGQFNNCKTLKSIVLPASVMGVGNTAFSECTGLESVTMNDEMETMGGSIFYNCISLQNFNWPKVRERNAVPDETFCGCKALRTVKLPDGLESIGKKAFYRCSNFEGNEPDISNIYIGDFYLSLTKASSDFTLGEYSFSGCNTLEQVILPEGLKVIPVGAFEECGNADFDLPNSLTTIEMYAFQGGGKSFILGETNVFDIPENVRYIGYRAFYKNTRWERLGICSFGTSSKAPLVIQTDAFRSSNLEHVSFLADYIEIGTGAFDSCKELKEFMIGAPTPPSVDNIFSGNPGPLDNPKFKVRLGPLLNKKHLEKYRTAYYWRNFADRIVLNWED